MPNLSYARYPECDKRITCLLGFKQVYGLKKIKFVQLGTIPVTKLIDSGKVTGDAVSAKLANAAMIAMNKAVAIDKKTPAAVAKAFLAATGLA